jgi:hypothetical protein
VRHESRIEILFLHAIFVSPADKQARRFLLKRSEVLGAERFDIILTRIQATWTLSRSPRPTVINHRWRRDYT